MIDRTLCGYCLPDATSLNDESANERYLNASSFHILRFIIHTSLYLASYDSPNEVYNVMNSHPEDLKQFYLTHMQKDLKIIARTLNLNIDEVIILIQSISVDILINEVSASKNYDRWSTKQNREDYEKEFYKVYLESKLKSYHQLISEANRNLVNDTMSDDQSHFFYIMAYELSIEDKKKENFLYENPEFWKYQPPCDFNVFKNELELTADNSLLKQFFKNVSFLNLNFREVPTIGYVCLLVILRHFNHLN